MGQEAHHKQSASFGVTLNESFLDEAIDCKMTHIWWRCAVPVRGDLTVSRQRRARRESRSGLCCTVLACSQKCDPLNEF